MKPTQTQQHELAPLLAFGAHPDDIEFGCGGVVVKETRGGRPAHFVICSRGEAATNGTPTERTNEAEEAAKILGATLEFIELDGDAHLELRAAHALKIAQIIRRVRPGIVLTPTLVENQHPDHLRLGQLVRDACRLARYGGIKELSALPAHRIESLFFYALNVDAEPRDVSPILVDISAPEIVAAWTKAMQAHATQARTLNYVEFQLTRARLQGLRAGIGHAMALYPSDPILVDSLDAVSRASRRF